MILVHSILPRDLKNHQLELRKDKETEEIRDKIRDSNLASLNFHFSGNL